MLIKNKDSLKFGMFLLLLIISIANIACKLFFIYIILYYKKKENNRNTIETRLSEHQSSECILEDEIQIFASCSAGVPHATFKSIQELQM